MDKKDRLEWVAKIVKERSPASLQFICNLYTHKTGERISKATISRDLARLDIQLDENGVYRLKEDRELLFEQQKLADLMRGRVSSFASNLPLVVLSVDQGFGQSIATMVEKVFSKDVFGTFYSDRLLGIFLRQGQDVDEFIAKLKEVGDVQN